jgi:HSP20 family molecular chaperone IbpA
MSTHVAINMASGDPICFGKAYRMNSSKLFDTNVVDGGSMNVGTQLENCIIDPTYKFNGDYVWPGDQFTNPDWLKPAYPCVPYGAYDDMEYKQSIEKLKRALWGEAATNKTRWRVIEQSDSIILAIDLPGVKPDKLNVTIDNFVLTVQAERFDADIKIHETFTLKDCYDIDTIDAVLECGVMTLTIKKFPERMPKKVQVKF